MTTEPLAIRMRPKTLEDIKGQEHLLKKDGILYNAIKNNELFSMILWGPPGTGKTTLAYIVSQITSSNFIRINAVASGIADLKKAIAEAKKLKSSLLSKETILFIDEIHRFNKAQQDFLLPFVEHKDVVLIGATTENPSFEVISPLLSRCKVFVLQPLSKDTIVEIMQQALKKDEIVQSMNITVGEEYLNSIAEYSFGDARFALSTLENVLNLSRQEKKKISKELLFEALQKKSLLYDKNAEEHYNIISALHKSMRDSDVDAAIYWTVRMLEGGEDPKYVVRRMIRFASEDIGMADPEALKLAIAVKESVIFLGMPECSTALTQLAVYLAKAPKNNFCYTAYLEAKADVDAFGPLPVPLHIRNAPTKLMKDLNYGKGYKYAHDYKDAKVDQEHLPKELKGKKYWKGE
jgi:putative ATPase